MIKRNILKLAVVAAALSLSVAGHAQKYENGLIDKTIAVVGNEMISLSELEQEILCTLQHLSQIQLFLFNEFMVEINLRS